MIIVPSEKRFDWAHAPLVLFAIVTLNALVFFLYQAADQQKFVKALNVYLDTQLLSLEWPAYQRYLVSEGDSERTRWATQLYQHGDVVELSSGMIMDRGFQAYVHDLQRSELSIEQYRVWRPARERVEALLDEMSAYSAGLIPQDLRPWTLLSYQFLHGGTMHLLGNLFFLVIFGFAAEAALGHWRFLAFYLVSGVVGGLTHALSDLNSSVPLVGASGAVSGVMAMYLGVFRMKKIEFFYWFFIFVGYFRAPALLVMPFFIGKELFSYIFSANHDVAFLAHAGGFAAGAALIAAALKWQPQTLNYEYIEENQQVDGKQRDLDALLKSLQRFKFAQALSLLGPMLKTYPNDFKLRLLHYRLTSAFKRENATDALKLLFATRHRHPADLYALAEAWVANPDFQEKLSPADKSKIALRFIDLEDPSLAESIFLQLQRIGARPESMGLLAKRLAAAFKHVQNEEKSRRYQDFANDYLDVAR